MLRSVLKIEGQFLQLKVNYNKLRLVITIKSQLQDIMNSSDN
jgi:hypothetical protein